MSYLFYRRGGHSFLQEKERGWTWNVVLFMHASNVNNNLFRKLKYVTSYMDFWEGI